MEIAGSREKYLDGLRGLAAMQVVFQHYTLAFLPASLARFGILADGNFAVFIFLVMSGFVLTPSFERQPHALISGLARRAVRLGLPAAVASAFAVLLTAAWPGQAPAAAALSGSSWLAGLQPITPAQALADMSGLSLITGSAETTLFGSVARFLPHWSASVDPPSWSLHLELWGSALVLVLVWLRARHTWLHSVALMLCAWFIGVNALNLFALGSVLSLMARGPWFPTLIACRGRRALGVALVAVGIWVEYGGWLPALRWLQETDAARALVHPFAWFSLSQECAAVLIFVAVLLLPELHGLLRGRLVQWLGKLSFAIYLLHFPIMRELGCAAFTMAVGWIGQGAAACLALVVGLAATFLVAVPFERVVDRSAIALSRRCGKRLVPAAA